MANIVTVSGVDYLLTHISGVPTFEFRNGLFDFSVTDSYNVETTASGGKITLWEIVGLMSSDDPNSIPGSDDPHPELSWARAKKVTPRYVGDPGYTWSVEVRYEYRGARNPLAEQPQIKYGSKTYTEVLDASWEYRSRKWWRTKPIQNAAGDLFDPPPEGERRTSLIKIVMNCAPLNPLTTPDYGLTEDPVEFELSRKYDYEGTVNNSPITIAGLSIAKYQARMLNIDPVPSTFVQTLTGEEIQYWQVTFEIEVAPQGETQELKLLNHGPNYLDSDGDKHAASVSGDDGMEHPEMVRLDENGEKLDDQKDGEYLAFHKYKPVNWDYLGLPEEAPDGLQSLKGAVELF